MGKVKELLNQNRDKIGEILRFGVTGVVSTLATYLFYYIFLNWLNPTISFTIAYLIAMAINYVMTTSFTFKVKANKKNAAVFVVSNIINYVLCAVFLNFFILLGVKEKWAPIPMYTICIPLNFIIVRYVMKENANKNSEK